MTELRRRMIQDMELRALKENTKRAYMDAVKDQRSAASRRSHAHLLDIDAPPIACYTTLRRLVNNPGIPVGRKDRQKHEASID